MKAIISFKNFDKDSVQWEIIKEWIQEQIDPHQKNTPLKYADSVEFKED